jgi:hypothetical protein
LLYRLSAERLHESVKQFSQ